MVKDYHVIEALGKTEVVIENGEVTSVGEPLVDYCPIFDKIDDAKHLTQEFIKWNIEKRIREFGMCTPQRVVKMPDMMSFGISEILKTNTELGLIDCVVGVCDGVGTLLMRDPEIIQGVGGRVSALVSTTPISEVIEKVGEENVVNPKTADLTPIKVQSIRGQKMLMFIFSWHTQQMLGMKKLKSHLNMLMLLQPVLPAKLETLLKKKKFIIPEQKCLFLQFPRKEGNF